MYNIITDLYQPLLESFGFVRCDGNKYFNPAGICWKISPELGEGYYWVYAQKDLFDIKIHDFLFYEDSLMEFNFPECLSITQYESISGEELTPCRKLSARCIKTFVGGHEPYKVLIHKSIPICCIGIEIMPAYYDGYLKKQYPGKYANPLSAFAQIDQTTNFPEMAQLLHQIKNYRGNGIAASLFYEAKIAEAVSLVVGARQQEKRAEERPLSEQDLSHLNEVAVYLNNHYAFETPLVRLAAIACMSPTKLKKTFKQLHNCTITEYVQQKRISEAERLLVKTGFTVGEIAQTVGYSSASRFAALFKKGTGISPLEYRKTFQM